MSTLERYKKVFIEASRALALWCATMLDSAEREGEKESEGLFNRGCG